MTALRWLPDDAGPNGSDWADRLRAMPALPAAAAWPEAVALATVRLDFLRTIRLDAAIGRTFADGPPAGLAGPPVRLAILGSSTVAHLHAGIRVAAARRGLFVSIYETGYGQYMQELADPGSGLHAFRPDAVLVALDAHHLAGGDGQRGDGAAEERLAQVWRLARTAFGCMVIQQTALPVHLPLLGGNEHRLTDSPAWRVDRLNHAMRAMADAAGVHLLALDARAARDGLAAWHDRALWHRAKQEVSPAAAALYGDLVARLLAAGQGRSAKCLVLDLDNTLWGGVVGDDGLAGLVLGQGTAQGEAFAAFQSYARALQRRGVILAVCSKNDEATALAAFESHPEMVLTRADIACFVANWQDKPANLRTIARTLNIGLDALVFADDNPFERALVRRELPMVAVPELTDEPADSPAILADAGYFEALAITAEDQARGRHYRDNQARAALQETATDLDAYLRGLEMELLWRPFDRVGLVRIVQLVNKTNQFNLTTRRITEAEALAVIDDPGAVGLQLRLLDRLGDNGMIAVVIARLAAGGTELAIDTWLMSCRVLGRQVEAATLELIVAEARRLGARRLLGTYVPSGRNAMVRDHYARLGFTELPDDRGGNAARLAVLELAAFAGGASPFIAVRQG